MPWPCFFLHPRTVPACNLPSARTEGQSRLASSPSLGCLGRSWLHAPCAALLPTSCLGQPFLLFSGAGLCCCLGHPVPLLLLLLPATPSGPPYRWSLHTRLLWLASLFLCFILLLSFSFFTHAFSLPWQYLSVSSLLLLSTSCFISYSLFLQ